MAYPQQVVPFGRKELPLAPGSQSRVEQESQLFRIQSKVSPQESPLSVEKRWAYLQEISFLGSWAYYLTVLAVVWLELQT